MTFVLGLVAEPIHSRYLNNPAPDRLAEVRGRQVLDKFNCAGCHQVRAGVYDLKLDDKEEGSRALLEDSYRKAKTTFGDDFDFHNHNAWAGGLPTGDRLTVLAADPRLDKIPRHDDKVLIARLADAATFLSRPRKEGDALVAAGAKGTAPYDGYQEVLTLRGGNDVYLMPDALTSRSDPFGGRFADLLTPYLLDQAKNNTTDAKRYSKFNEENTARAGLPPPLVREGEKVQPEWLFGFLRNPTPIRPMTVLRMPKFNMSDDEAQALVNYFAAADKLHNPGIGLTYPYLTVPERREAYWQDRNREYADTLARENKLEERAKAYLGEAQKRLEGAKDRDKAELEQEIKRLKEALDEKDANKRKAALARTDLYWHDGYRLLTTSGQNAICLKCHSVGTHKASEEQGPPLDLASARLRPDWTERWLANPNRLLTYPTPMPQNFPNGKEQFRELFDAPSRQQVQALRDVLMNYPKVADLPVNRSYPPAATSGGQ
jgi:hypothetical protein